MNIRKVDNKMGETFMTAGTQIEGLIEKRDAILDKTAGLLAEAVIDRAKSGNLKKSTEKDITNLIKDFGADEQAIITRKALLLVAMNAKFGPSQMNDAYDDATRSLHSNRSQSNIFQNRRKG